MRNLEDELSKSLKPFSPSGIENLLTPRYLPLPLPMPNRLPPSDTEKPGNWLFQNPGDSSVLSGPDPFKSFDGSPKKPSLEDLYKSLDPKQPDRRTGSAKSSGSSDLGFDPFDQSDDHDPNVPANLRESVKSLREKLLGPGSIFERPSSTFDGFSRGVSGLFAPKDNSLSPEQIQAHQDYIQRYREALDIPAPLPAPQNTIKTILGLSDSPAGTGTPVYTPPSLPTASASSGNIFASTPLEANAALQPASLPDLNDQVLNHWNPLYAAPKLESAPAPRPFSPPMMEVPRRQFQ